MTTATGIGSMPGSEQGDFDEAVRLVLGALPDLPHLPEVPGRGAVADLVGRSLAIASVSGIGADLQPAGWRLTDASGIDQRRAVSLLAQDLDTLEEQAQGLSGAFKVQVAGPWTLAAAVEKPRGDKVLSDRGARRDLAQGLAEGLRAHVADVRRRLPDVTRLIVQVDEPALGAVLAAQVPTASGFGRHRAVHPPEASAATEWVLGAIAQAGAEPWVHSCAAGIPWGQLVLDGARGLSVDLSVLLARDHDALAEAIEEGASVALGVVPPLDPARVPLDTQLVETVVRWLDMLGLDPETVGGQLVVTPACGLAGATPAWARRALELSRSTAAALDG